MVRDTLIAGCKDNRVIAMRSSLARSSITQRQVDTFGRSFRALYLTMTEETVTKLLRNFLSIEYAVYAFYQVQIDNRVVRILKLSNQFFSLLLGLIKYKLSVLG